MENFRVGALPATGNEHRYVGSRAAFEAMNAAISLHQLRPVIDRVFPFQQARDAYAHFAAKRHVGKVVIAA